MAGFAISKTEMYIPTSIRSALQFDSESIYLVLLSFMITMLAGNIIANILDRDNRIHIGDRGLVLSVLGSLLMGIGMACAGSELLTLWVQIGTGCEAALWICIGAMSAGLTFFLVLGHIRDSSRLFREPFLDRLVSRKKNIFPFVAGTVLVILLGVCGLVNIDGVTKGPKPKIEDFVPDPRKSNWSPYAAGCLLGLSAIPLRIFYRARLQGYCGFISLICFPVNQICCMLNIKRDSYIAYTGSFESLWVLFMGVGVSLGALLSASLSNDLAKIKCKDWVQPFVGGYVMMAGALLADGDLFSHLQGVADLHIPSMFNVACVSAGAFIYYPLADFVKDLF